MPEPVVIALIAAVGGVIGGVVSAIARPWGQDYVNRRLEERAQARAAEESIDRVAAISANRSAEVHQAMLEAMAEAVAATGEIGHGRGSTFDERAMTQGRAAEARVSVARAQITDPELIAICDGYLAASAKVFGRSHMNTGWSEHSASLRALRDRASDRVRVIDL